MKRTPVFLLISSVLLISIIVELAALGSAVTATQRQTAYNDVMMQNFQIRLIPTATNAHNRVDIGGKKMLSWENRGYIETPTGARFKSQMKLQFTANFYTDNDLTNTFLIASKTSGSINWLSLECDENWVDAAGRTTNSYSTQYDTYSLSILRATGITQPYTLDIDFINFDEKYYQQSGRNDSVLIDKPLFMPIEARAGSFTVKRLDQYKDTFTETQTVKLDAVDLRATSASTASASAGDASSDVLAKIQDLALGVVPVTTTPTPITVQQKSLQAVTVGSILTKSGNNENATFRLFVRNAPEVIKYQQNLRYRSASMQVDTKDGVILKDAGIRSCSPVSQNDVSRIVGYRTNNWVIQQNYTIDYFVYSDVEFTPEQQAFYLSNPEFIKGDVVWDCALTGNTGVSLVFAEANDPTDDILSMAKKIAIIVGIALGIGLAIYITFMIVKSRMSASIAGR